MFDEENLISLAIFSSFRIILVLSVVDFILCFKKQNLKSQESIFKQADESLFENESCILKI